MKTVTTKIEGVTPLIYDRPTYEEITGKTKRQGLVGATPLEERLHKNGHGVFIPFWWIHKACQVAAKRTKEPGRRGASYLVSYSGLVTISTDEIPLTPNEWVRSPENIFSRHLRRKDGNVVWKESPIFREWSAEFQFEVDGFDTDVLREILEEAGKINGLGGWRPQCGGRFGKFKVVKWEVK